MSQQVTYGDLIVTATKFLDDTEAALAATVSYRDLLDALHRHGRVLLGTEVCAAGLRASDHSDPVQAASRTLIAD